MVLLTIVTKEPVTQNAPTVGVVPVARFPETVLPVSVTASAPVAIPPPWALYPVVLFPETVLPVSVTAAKTVKIPPP